MAARYKKADHGSCNYLKISGIEHIPNSIRGENRLKQLLQRQSFLTYTVKAIQYAAVNRKLDFLPVL